MATALDLIREKMVSRRIVAQSVLRVSLLAVVNSASYVGPIRAWAYEVFRNSWMWL